MSEITPYGDDEMSEHGLRIRCKDLRGRIQELEAKLFNQTERVEEFKREVERREELMAGADHRNAELEARCAAMREELERVAQTVHQARCEDGGSWWDCPMTVCATRTALATDAGKAMLEEVSMLRGVVQRERESGFSGRQRKALETELAATRERAEKAERERDGFRSQEAGHCREHHRYGCPQCTLDAFGRERNGLRAQLAEARAVLRAVRVCPFPTCNWLELGSHAPDCRLAKCIEDLT